MDFVATDWMPVVSRARLALSFLIARAPVALAAAAVIVLGAASHDPVVGIVVCAVAVVLYLGYAVSSSDRVRRQARGLRHGTIARPDRRRRWVDPATAREACFALAELFIAPAELVVATCWLIAGPLLIAAPLLASGESVSAGPVHLAVAHQAWLAMGLGWVLLACGLTALVVTAGWHAALAEYLLGPRPEQLRRDLVEIRRSRLRLVDAFDVERRRIERDLHDGAQQQLITLAMKLDLAQHELERADTARTRKLLQQAQSQAADAMTGLRDLIQGIQPPVLTDVGLDGALQRLAEDAAVPVTLSVALPDRLPATVESAAWFVVSEALTNAVRHGQASHVEITARTRGGHLRVTVTDDGMGGADPASGSGLIGLADRVAALDGHLSVASPPGGPTLVVADMDCRPPAGA